MKTLMKGLVLSLALVLGAGPALADTIKIGVAGAHSGDLASYGLPAVNAAKLVAEKVNAQGGVNGMMVEVQAEDDQCKPEMATNAATTLVSDKATVIIGHICSGATKAALPIYKAANLVVMSPSATNPPLTKSGEFPNFFRTIATDDEQGPALAAFAANKLNLKKVAIIHDKGDYGKGVAEFCKAAMEKAGKVKVVLFEGIGADQVDYAAVIQKIKQAGAEGVVYGGYHPGASKLISQMRKKKIAIPFLTDEGVQGPDFLKLAGNDAEGAYATGLIDVSGNAMYKAAAEAHQKAFGTAETGLFFAQAYAATQSLLNAIDKAKSTKYEDIMKALHTETADTCLGKIKFNAQGDAQAEGVGFSVYQVKNGKWELNK